MVHEVLTSWTFVEVHEIPWICMDIHGHFRWISMAIFVYVVTLSTHTLEEFKLVKSSSYVPRETRLTNKLRVSFLVCFDDSPHQIVLKGSSLD